MKRLRIVPFVLWLVPACQHPVGPAARGEGAGERHVPLTNVAQRDVAALNTAAKSC